MLKNRSLVMVSGLCAIGASAHGATFQGVGDLAGGTFSSHAMNVSGDGRVVVGYSTTATGPEAFRWDAINGMVGLGDLAGGAFTSEAYAASGDGGVIVGYSKSANGDEAFRWDAVHGIVAMGDLAGGAFSSRARGVSTDGQVIVGAGVTDEGGRGFVWDAVNGMVPLADPPGGFPAGSGAIATNADGSVTSGFGSSGAHSLGEACRWVGGVPEGLSAPTTDFSDANDINADGSVVVGYMQTGAQSRAFRWTQAGGLVNLGVLSGASGASSNSRAVNADGTVIVGSSSVSSSAIGAFIWRDGHGMERLSTVLTNEYGLDLTGWTLQSAYGVSADGLVIVGWGTNPSGQAEGWIANLRAPVPACAGDVTGDGETNISDFNVLSLNFGQSVTPNTNGDLTGDGLVNIADFNILAGDFGCGAS